MAEIKNYTMNFSFGRSPLAHLTFALQKLAYTEIHRSCSLAKAALHG
jgi:hypothetical protein